MILTSFSFLFNATCLYFVNMSLNDIFQGMMIMNLVTWLALGAIAGFIAHFIDPGEVKGGIIGTIITGLLGAFVGGVLANTFFGVGVDGLNLQSLIVASVGALLVVAIQRMMFRNSGHIKTSTMTKRIGEGDDL